MEWALLGLALGALLFTLRNRISPAAAGTSPLPPAAADFPPLTGDVWNLFTTPGPWMELVPAPAVIPRWETWTAPVQISNTGLRLIQNSEGLRLVAYEDPPGSGRYSVGYGHSGVARGTRITQAQAEQWLREDVDGAELCVRTVVTVPLTQGQFDALTDFVYNLGCAALKRSTLLSYLNAGNYERAAGEFKRWVYAGDVISSGLVTRRTAEEALFRAG